MNSQAATVDPSALLTELTLSLGQVRAEYSPDETIFSGFSWPVYWGELVGPRPCVLVGGRGTGKTTTLRGLAFSGQFALRGPEISRWDSIGAYWRIDSMAVSAFQGRAIDEKEWIPAFSHYVNLKMTELFLSFCQWRSNELNIDTIVAPESIELSSIAMNLPATRDLRELARLVKFGIARLEARLNGSTEELFQHDFSTLGRPIAYLIDGIDSADPIARVPFSFCIDEFENLLPYQQRIINTLIKHVGDSGYTIKIGVRASEQRERDTLAIGQPLIDPADYTTVDIVQHLKDQSFITFASQVCEKRFEDTSFSSLKMKNAFPNLPLEEEAKLLGADKRKLRIRSHLKSEHVTQEHLKQFDDMPLLSACFIEYWAKAQSLPFKQVLEEALADKRGWDQRLGNHSYALLFTLRHGLRGIRKYYSGWSTYCLLANGNIRLLLELAYEALRLQISETGILSDEISAERQTLAAQTVGKTTLQEIQGQSRIGGQLTRLTLSLGRVFNVFAAEPEGHAPEVNQIRIETERSVTSSTDIDYVLGEAVSNGCLVAFEGNKQERASAQTKSSDYHLHPIFAPYFVFSYRRKRRIQLSGDELMGLTLEVAPRVITDILQRRQRRPSPLPEQLDLYSGFFDEN